MRRKDDYGMDQEWGDDDWGFSTSDDWKPGPSFPGPKRLAAMKSSNGRRMAVRLPQKPWMKTLQQYIPSNPSSALKLAVAMLMVGMFLFAFASGLSLFSTAAPDDYTVPQGLDTVKQDPLYDTKAQLKDPTARLNLVLNGEGLDTEETTASERLAEWLPGTQRANSGVKPFGDLGVAGVQQDNPILPPNLQGSKFENNAIMKALDPDLLTESETTRTQVVQDTAMQLLENVAADKRGVHTPGSNIAFQDGVNTGDSLGDLLNLDQPAGKTTSKLGALGSNAFLASQRETSDAQRRIDLQDDGGDTGEDNGGDSHNRQGQRRYGSRFGIRQRKRRADRTRQDKKKTQINTEGFVDDLVHDAKREIVKGINTALDALVVNNGTGLEENKLKDMAARGQEMVLQLSEKAEAQQQGAAPEDDEVDEDETSSQEPLYYADNVHPNLLQEPWDEDAPSKDKPAHKAKGTKDEEEEEDADSSIGSRGAGNTEEEEAEEEVDSKNGHLVNAESKGAQSDGLPQNKKSKSSHDSSQTRLDDDDVDEDEHMTSEHDKALAKGKQQDATEKSKPSSVLNEEDDDGERVEESEKDSTPGNNLHSGETASKAAGDRSKGGGMLQDEEGGEGEEVARPKGGRPASVRSDEEEEEEEGSLYEVKGKPKPAATRKETKQRRSSGKAKSYEVHKDHIGKDMDELLGDEDALEVDSLDSSEAQKKHAKTVDTEMEELLGIRESTSVRKEAEREQKPSVKEKGGSGTERLSEEEEEAEEEDVDSEEGMRTPGSGAGKPESGSRSKQPGEKSKAVKAPVGNSIEGEEEEEDERSAEDADRGNFATKTATAKLIAKLDKGKHDAEFVYAGNMTNVTKDVVLDSESSKETVAEGKASLHHIGSNTEASSKERQTVKVETVQEAPKAKEGEEQGAGMGLESVTSDKATSDKALEEADTHEESRTNAEVAKDVVQATQTVSEGNSKAETVLSMPVAEESSKPDGAEKEMGEGGSTADKVVNKENVDPAIEIPVVSEAVATAQDDKQAVVGKAQPEEMPDLEAAKYDVAIVDEDSFEELDDSDPEEDLLSDASKPTEGTPQGKAASNADAALGDAEQAQPTEGLTVTEEGQPDADNGNTPPLLDKDTTPAKDPSEAVLDSGSEGTAEAEATSSGAAEGAQQQPEAESQSNVAVVADSQSNVAVVADSQSNVAVVADSQSNVAVVADSQSDVAVVADSQSDVAVVADSQSDVAVVADSQSDVAVVADSQSDVVEQQRKLRRSC